MRKHRLGRPVIRRIRSKLPQVKFEGFLVLETEADAETRLGTMCSGFEPPNDVDTDFHIFWPSPSMPHIPI